MTAKNYKRVQPVPKAPAIPGKFQAMLDDRISVIDKYSGKKVTPKETGLKILHENNALKCWLIIEGGKYIVSFETSAGFIERAMTFNDERTFLSQFAY